MAKETHVVIAYTIVMFNDLSPVVLQPQRHKDKRNIYTKDRVLILPPFYQKRLFFQLFPTLNTYFCQKSVGTTHMLFVKMSL